MKKNGILAPHRGIVYGYLVPVLTGGLFIMLIAVSVFVMYYQAKDDTGDIINQELKRLQAIFERIDADCTILGFDYHKNPINFLTIKKNGFVGSEVGSVNLRNPKGWAGPYTQDNPVVQGRVYQIVVTKTGAYITPGDGVKLPNGSIVGVTVKLTPETDMRALMASEQGFLYKNYVLAVPLKLKENALMPHITPGWSEELV